jgi:hypothetical protein
VPEYGIFTLIKTVQESSSEEDYLFYATLDSIVREKLDEHQIDANHERLIKDRFLNNYPEGFKIGYNCLHDFMDTNLDLAAISLDPGQSITEMRMILKAQEKYLLVQQWKEAWEQIRPPQSKWYERRDSSFSHELSRCRKLLASRGNTC